MTRAEGSQAPARVPLVRAVDIRATREEWRALRVWMDEHGYNAQRGESLDAWRTRTAPVSYIYAQVIEVAYEDDDVDPFLTGPERRTNTAHEETPINGTPYCVLCGAVDQGAPNRYYHPEFYA